MFSLKIFTNGLNVGFSLQVEKTVHGVETHWHSSKENVPGAAVSKECRTDCVLRHERFGFVSFRFMVSTIVDYSVLNPVYSYILCMICKHKSFIYTLLNDQTVLFQTIQFSINSLFAHDLNIKQFYLTHRLYVFRCYHSGWTKGQLKWRCSSHSLKLQHYWSLTIRLFVIYRTFTGGILSLCRDAVSVFYNPSWLGHKTFVGEERVLSFCRDEIVYFTAPADWAGPERSHHNWFPWKRCNWKQCFLLQKP